MGKEDNHEKTEFGNIIFHYTDYEPNYLCRIIGHSKNTPYLINKVDGDLWQDYWETKGREFEIKYVHGQSRFDKDFKNFVSKEEKNDFRNKIYDLIQNYSKSAEKYNKEISEPFVKERKALLNKIFEL